MKTNWKTTYDLYYIATFALFYGGLIGAWFIGPIFGLNTPWLWLGCIVSAIALTFIAGVHLKHKR